MGLGKVPDGLGMVFDSLEKVSNGHGEVYDGLRILLDGLGKVLDDGIRKVLDGLGNVSDGLMKVSDGLGVQGFSKNKSHLGVRDIKTLPSFGPPPHRAPPLMGSWGERSQGGRRTSQELSVVCPVDNKPFTDM